MNMQELLRGVDCTCGRRHSCDIAAVRIERGVLAHLPALAANHERILLVADENTYATCGETAVAALSGKRVGRVIFDGGRILVPDEIAIARVEAALGDATLILGIGSGVIQDLCKYVAHTHGLPYIIVATAPSMDGYASSGAAMITDGMKVTYPAAVPYAILADPDVLANAPLEMLRAGYGDILGKLSCLSDWRLSHVVNGEYFCQYIYDLTMQAVQKTLPLAERLLARDPDAVATLMEALVLVGIAMSFAGSSRPASGSEHHLSHFFEITGLTFGKPYLPHGIDVACSTLVTARLREKLASMTPPRSVSTLSREEYELAMRRVYGKTAAGCIALQDKVGSYKQSRLAVYAARWQDILSALAECPPATEIEAQLARIGISYADFAALYGEEKIDNAVLFSKDLKDRYTVLWLNYDVTDWRGM